jgi:MiaB/RimO family radical SAM methylthiotransferase
LASEDTGVYGADIHSSLPELINAVTALGGDFHVRVGMMNPNAAKRLLPQLLDAFDSDKVYKFAHVPVQSGSDAVLRAMNRQHSVKDFEQVAAAFRGRFPDCVISTDIIVGFPGETEADFKRTLALLKRVKPDVTNTSRFCPRPETAAAKMRQTITQVKKARSIECSALAKRISRERNGLFVGREYHTVALERARKGGVIGRAPNYKQLVFEGELGGEYDVRVVAGLPFCLKAGVV